MRQLKGLKWPNGLPLPSVVLLAEVARYHIPLDIVRHWRPPVVPIVAGHQLQGFVDTLVSSVQAEMHFFQKVGTKPECIRHNYLSVM